MRRVNSVAGIAWAADILLGNKPIPTSGTKNAQRSGDDFKAVLDEAQQKLQQKGAKA